MLKNAALKLANTIGETGIFRLLCPQRVPVFMLHRIFNSEKQALAVGMQAQVLRSYLQYLAKRGYRVLTMHELWRMLNQHEPIPSKSAMFTIDDGFFDHHDVAAKVFEEFGFALNFFVITGFLDQELWPWDDQITYALHRTKRDRVDVTLPSGAVHALDLSQGDVGASVNELRSRLKAEPQEDLYSWLRTELYECLSVQYPCHIPKEFSPMSWSDARALQKAGHGVYPHTLSHRILSMLSPEEKQHEINHSRDRVRDELKCQSDVFAYPTGRRSDYDHADIKQLKVSGFRMAFNTVPNYVVSGQSFFELPRFSLPRKFEDFRQIVNRFEALKTRLRA